MSATKTNTAIKAVYDRGTKTYKVKAVHDVHSLGTYAQDGYLVYDDAARMVREIEAGKMLSDLKAEKRAAILAFLRDEEV